MTVKELIAKLKELPDQDQIIWIRDFYDNDYPIADDVLSVEYGKEKYYVLEAE